MSHTQAVRGRRRRVAWERVSHGLYSTGACDPLAAWQLVLPPSGRFTHLTAAARLGWWVPPLPDQLPALAAVDRGSTRPERAGLHVVRTDPALAPVLVDGVRIDAPEEILLACARDLGLMDLLVLADGALDKGDLDGDRLRRVTSSRRRGAGRLREAVGLADRRSESPWETVLRLFHQTCEAPVEPQREILDANGAFVARADLWLVGTSSIHEYDGGVHLERRRQQSDLARARRLSDAGFVRRGYTSHDLLRHPVGVLRDIDRALERTHDPSRLRTWHALLAESLHTRAGVERLLSRLRGVQR